MNIAVKGSKRFFRCAVGAVTAVCLMSTTVSVYAGERTVDNLVEESGAQLLTENPLNLVEVMEEQQREETRLAAEEAAREAEEARRQQELEEQQRAEEARVAARQELVDFALQFVGNPYVYGGTSLTNGADCSGFVQSVFANFGYSLPRVADAQAYAGQEKSMDELEAGDLLFYGYGGSITHVAIYIGEGQIVHASTAATGIKVSEYNYNQPCMAVTYLA